MKKSMWGYSTEEVDETVDSLESQIYVLNQKIKKLETERGVFEEKIKNLTEELNAALDVAKTADEKISSAKAEAAEAKALAEKEAAAKEAAVRELAEKTQSSLNDSSQSNVSDAHGKMDIISNIFCSAYEDMSNVKSLTRERLEELLRLFAEGYKKSNDKLKELINQIISSRDAARDSFVDAADQILNRFTGIGDAMDEMASSVEEYESKRIEMVSELEGILSSLDEAPENIDGIIKGKSEDSHEQDDNTPEIMRAIKKHNERKNNNASNTENHSDSTSNKIYEAPTLPEIPAVKPQEQEQEKTNPKSTFGDVIDVSVFVKAKDVIGPAGSDKK